MKVVAHPPERRRRGTTLAAHGCCCCCCCCCLHTLGGLIAGGVASARAKSPEGRRTARAYWLLVLVTGGIGFAGMAAKEGGAAGLLLLALGLPLAQLNASLLTLLLAAVVPLDLRALGSITWKSLMWAVIGLIVMIAPFLPQMLG